MEALKLKNFKPKYQNLELAINRYGEDLTLAHPLCSKIASITYKDACKKYGDLELLSVVDYDDTKTTRIILKKFEVY